MSVYAACIHARYLVTKCAFLETDLFSWRDQKVIIIIITSLLKTH